MNKVPDAYDSHDADYFLREAVSNLKGKIDFLYYGGLDEEGEDAALEFYEKLSRQCFIVRQNNCRFLSILYNIGNRKCFSRTGNSEKGLVFFANIQTFRQLFNCLRLIAGWFVF